VQNKFIFYSLIILGFSLKVVSKETAGMKNTRSVKTTKISESLAIEIKHTQQGENTEFQIVSIVKDGTPIFELRKKDGDSVISKKIIKAADFNSIKSETLSIIWDTNFKQKKTTPEKCVSYAKLAVSKDKALVCKDNLKSVGRTSSLFYKLEEMIVL
jgi:hypothetical protein